MKGTIAEFFETDHHRLDELLRRASADAHAIDLQAYAEFRKGLLGHISMEEKILFPTVQRLRGGEPFPQTKQLRLDHAALTALMVPPPSAGIIAAIRAILSRHNALEESTYGVYETSDELAAGLGDEIVQQARKAGNVPVLPHNPDPRVLEATRRAVARAGYDLDRYLSSAEDETGMPAGNT